MPRPSEPQKLNRNSDTLVHFGQDIRFNNELPTHRLL